MWHDLQGRFVVLGKTFIKLSFIISIIQYYEYTGTWSFYLQEYKFTSLLKETSSNSESALAQRKKETVRQINDLMMIVYYLYYSLNWDWIFYLFSVAQRLIVKVSSPKSWMENR